MSEWQGLQSKIRYKCYATRVAAKCVIFATSISSQEPAYPKDAYGFSYQDNHVL
jgi:hypothetical protein